MPEAVEMVRPRGARMLTVSVILVVRNGAQFIAEALASVGQAGRQPLEILVIDGHSTDETVEIASRFPGVRVIPQEKSGIPAAYNQGIALARSDTVAFISHDDIWTEGKLDLQLRAMETDPSLQFTVGMVEHFLSGSSLPPVFRRDLLDKPVPGFIMEALVARKSVFERIGLFDTSFAVGEDTDWFARAKDAGVPMKLLPEILVRKRIHQNNSTLNTANTNKLLLRALRSSIDRKSQKAQQGSDDAG